LPASLDCMTITRGIVELANGLGMTTTAEGVETPEQLYVLRTYGCTHGQGYLFSRPLPAAEIAAMLKTHHDAVNGAAA
jgi:EAL domain-containing protein (putative c-di-GMP-specific phosphodiesterase class I)